MHLKKDPSIKEILERNTHKQIPDYNSNILERVLSPRELEIADLIKQGKPNKEIAQILHLSVRTVESHRYTLRVKIGLKNKRKIKLRDQLFLLIQGINKN